MGLIRAIIVLFVLAVIVVFGYWLYASYVAGPNAPYYAEINSKMPDPLRRWSCAQIKTRTTGAAPASCEGY